MKTLIVEDDLTSRILLQEILRPYCNVHVAVNGVEAIEAVEKALDLCEPYALICLDIMMPEMDGQEALRQIRAAEERQGIVSSEGAKIFMTTALDDIKTVTKAYGDLCDGYLVKPLDKAKMLQELANHNLIPATS